MGWTTWRKIANRQHCFPESLDYDGPSCYELAIAGPRAGALRVVYAGETVNERQRMMDYAIHGSHKAEIINWHLKRGWSLWYRACAKPSKTKARAMQDRLLFRFHYDWNVQMLVSRWDR